MSRLTGGRSSQSLEGQTARPSTTTHYISPEYQQTNSQQVQSILQSAPGITEIQTILGKICILVMHQFFEIKTFTKIKILNYKKT